MAAGAINDPSSSPLLLLLIVLLKASNLLRFILDPRCSIFAGLFLVLLLLLRWTQPFVETVRNAFMRSLDDQALRFSRKIRPLNAAWRIGVESFIAHDQPFSIAAYKACIEFHKAQEFDSENRARTEAERSLLHEIMPTVTSFLIGSHAFFYNLVMGFWTAMKVLGMHCIKDDTKVNIDQICEACRDIGLVNYQTLLDGLLAALLTVSLFISKIKVVFFCAPIAFWLLLGMRIIHYNAKVMADSDANQVAVQDSFNASEFDPQDCDLVDDGESIGEDGVDGGDEAPLAGLASESGGKRGQCKELETLAGWELIDSDAL